jgi:hypothetical protein
MAQWPSAQTRFRALPHTRRMLSLRERRHAMLVILDARFSLGALEAVRRRNPEYWASSRSDLSRETYREAMRQKQHLLGASDADLDAELQAIRLAA